MNKLKTLLESEPRYQGMLYKRGYLITDNKIEALDTYPFFGNWLHYEVKNNKCDLNIYIHNEQKIFRYEEDNTSIVLIGHAYNPFENEQSEDSIIRNCIAAYKSGRECFFDKISELTGIHLILISSDKDFFILQDCCGIMPVYYGKVRGSLYLSSHAQLIADICYLSMSKRIEKYINAYFYRIGISQLCGLDSPFDELIMLSPNTFLELPDFMVTRFYPLLSIKESRDISQIADILKSSVLLCSNKWDCSISLTGGVDSKMTLASANGIYDRFKYFSFISSEAEQRDALAAHRICDNLGLEHVIFEISNEETSICDYSIVSSIMAHNQAYLTDKHGNDMRKRAYLANHTDISLEIKSHVSEVGRAFYYKKLGKKRFRFPLTPRNMSNLAKRNFFDRKILKDMDNSFKRFIDITKFGNFPDGFDETDMFYWENRLPAWGALVKQSFDISHETTIIYNNRKLLEMILSFPFEDRLRDSLHLELIELMNPNISEMNISNANAMKNKKRIFIEKAFYELNSRL